MAASTRRDDGAAPSWGARRAIRQALCFCARVPEARLSRGRSDPGAIWRAPGGSADGRGPPPRAAGKMIPCNGIRILHHRRVGTTECRPRGGQRGEPQRAGKRVDAERPRLLWREAEAGERCRWHVSADAAGVSPRDLRGADGAPFFSRARAGAQRAKGPARRPRSIAPAARSAQCSYLRRGLVNLSS